LLFFLVEIEVQTRNTTRDTLVVRDMYVSAYDPSVVPHLSLSVRGQYAQSAVVGVWIYHTLEDVRLSLLAGHGANEVTTRRLSRPIGLHWEQGECCPLAVGFVIRAGVAWDPDPFVSDTTSVALPPSSGTPPRLTILFLDAAYLQDKRSDRSTCFVPMHGCGEATVA